MFLCRYVRSMADVSAHTVAVGRVWSQPSPLQQRPVRPAHLDAIPPTHRYHANTVHTPGGDPPNPSQVIFLGQGMLKLSVVNAVIGLLFFLHRKHFSSGVFSFMGEYSPTWPNFTFSLILNGALSILLTLLFRNIIRKVFSTVLQSTVPKTVDKKRKQNQPQ